MDWNETLISLAASSGPRCRLAGVLDAPTYAKLKRRSKGLAEGRDGASGMMETFVKISNASSLLRGRWCGSLKKYLSSLGLSRESACSGRGSFGFSATGSSSSTEPLWASPEESPEAVFGSADISSFCELPPLHGKGGGDEEGSATLLLVFPDMRDMRTSAV